jgi:hypothetical protein
LEGLAIASANKKVASTTRFLVSMKRLQGCSDPAPDALTLANSTPTFGSEPRHISGAKKKQAYKTWMLLDDKGDTMLL